MKLVPVSLDDLALYEAMFGSEEYMRELGGPQPADKIPGILQRQVSCMQTNKGWVYKILLEQADSSSVTDDMHNVAIGTICVWTGFDEKRQEEISELGYGVLPQYQGHGFATKAVSMVLDLAKIDTRWGVIHCYTNVTNVASIRLCERLGFDLLEEVQIDYDGRPFLAKHFTFDTLPKADVQPSS